MRTSSRFTDWWEDVHRTSCLGLVDLGASREFIRDAFGEPDAVARRRRKQPDAGIWRYANVEFHFDHAGLLWLIYEIHRRREPRVIAIR